MKKIKVYARFLEVLGIILAILPVVGLFFKWFSAAVPHGKHASFYATIAIKAPATFLASFAQNSAAHRLLGFLVDGISVVLIFFGVVTFVRIMRCIRRSEIFSQRSVLLFRRLSILALLWALYNPIQTMLLSLVENLHNPAGPRIVFLTFSSDDIVNIFIFGFFLVITSLMQEANALKKEHELTV